MRDKKFVAEHCGGPLTIDQHRQLVLWACKCVENVLPLIEKADERLINAIAVAKELTNPIEILVARSVGHAVATAHMADHSLKAADYALKATKLTEKPTDIERMYQ